MASDIAPHALIGDPDAEIVALERALRRAQLDADVAALDRLISDDLLFTGPDGQLVSKAQDLASHTSGVVRFRRHDVDALQVRRVSADVAICALRTELTVEVSGETIHGWFRYTRMWVRGDDGAWRVTGGHVSALPGGASPTRETLVQIAFDDVANDVQTVHQHGTDKSARGASSG